MAAGVTEVIVEKEQEGGDKNKTATPPTEAIKKEATPSRPAITNNKKSK
jgi:hypothetical protein